jgi:hypothetical protein
MADVKGSSFVHIDGENATDYILVNYVFGGNDIAGHIGTAKAVGDTIPEELTEVRREAADLTNEKLNTVDKTFNSYVRVSTKTAYTTAEITAATEGDPAYGSNFPLMISLNNHMRFLSNRPYLELSCRYNDSRKSILSSGNCDIDNLSWAHEIAGAFDGIYICHTTAVFCRDFGYPVVDVLHMNDFWNEVHVRYQQFATQDPNYKYPRD